ncbi:MAG TPA: glycoside hydrolase family 1 protein [Candidatus Saccharibacteria bacterium]|nr:glycoside hydrolase family 1 protein [Candidatus Saccharibacteria bacterium]
MSKSIFPKDFFWGVSTASHQVEGGTENQWSTWELAHAKELAKSAEQRLGMLPIWDEIKTEAQDPQNYVSGKGVEHYKRYKEDFAIVEKLGLNAFRFGIEWSRVQPEEGTWDEKALEHYRDYIAELQARDIEPFVNLWHWTMPTWFTDKGGFKYRKNLSYWRKFVQKISDEFGSDIRYVITINEPNVYASFSYATGEWPPQEKNWLNASRVIWNLVLAHKIAYKTLKKDHPHLSIGIAAQLANIQAKRPHNFIDELMTKWMRMFWNWWFMNRIRKQQDFVGFNYYFSDYYKYFHRDNPGQPQNDLGWYMEPEGLYPLLLRAWSHYKKPIFITENGVADRTDQYRQWWLEETIIAMERALSEGIDVRGYFHWSLLDNFEWKYGWWPKFGLVEVDREHDMKRTIRPSGRWLARKIQAMKHGSPPTKE